MIKEGVRSLKAITFIFREEISVEIIKEKCC
jgi:hypothetical protein